jgi:hypothetical protein
VVLQLEALIESRGGLACVEVWRDDLVPGRAQVIRGAQFHRARSPNMEWNSAILATA